MARDRPVDDSRYNKFGRLHLTGSGKVYADNPKTLKALGTLEASDAPKDNKAPKAINSKRK